MPVCLEDFDRFFTPMKETKITKRIFAVFVAFIVILLISCGHLYVFADSNPSLTVIFNCNFNFFEWVAYSSCTYIKVDDGTNLTSFSVGFDSNNVLRADLTDFNFTRRLQLKYEFRRVNELGVTVVRYGVFSISGVTLPHAATGSPHFSLTSFPLTVTVDVSLSSGDGNNYYYCYLDNDYIPSTPEPTPTPDPTPTPEPTFNPDQPTYSTFFNHLLNDGNNALNALYLSWTSANNKFYTGLFFIGLPIMIGIFGIVASIFFGGDD